MKKVADKLASFVAKNGRQFEHVTRQKNPGDTPFKYVSFNLFLLLIYVEIIFFCTLICKEKVNFYLPKISIKCLYFCLILWITFAGFYLMKIVQITSIMNINLVKSRRLCPSQEIPRSYKVVSLLISAILEAISIYSTHFVVLYVSTFACSSQIIMINPFLCLILLG